MKNNQNKTLIASLALLCGIFTISSPNTYAATLTHSSVFLADAHPVNPLHPEIDVDPVPPQPSASKKKSPEPEPKKITVSDHNLNKDTKIVKEKAKPEQTKSLLKKQPQLYLIKDNGLPLTSNPHLGSGASGKKNSSVGTVLSYSSGILVYGVKGF